MFDVKFKLDETETLVSLCVLTHDGRMPSEDDIRRELRQSDFKHYFILEENLKQIAAFLVQRNADRMKPGASADLHAPDEVSFPEPIAERRHADLFIEITGDHMQAVATLTTAAGGDQLGKDAILNKIRGAGVRKGYIKEAIERIIVNDRKAAPGHEFTEIIAQGLEPEPGVPSQLVSLVTPIQDRVLVPQERDDGTLDMRDLGEIETVKVGDPLMRVQPAESGKNGYNVHGEVIFSKTPDNLRFTVGDGTRVDLLDSMLLVASRAGVPLKIKGGMMVSEVLIVQEVDLKVGNLNYDGNILVKGNVVGGMTVKSTGDIIVNGFVESSEIIAGGSVVIKQGVLGKETHDEHTGELVFSAHVEAGRDITARYAQHACMKAGTSVKISNQILHCQVDADDEVQVGHTNQRKSKLIGGTVRAGRLVSAAIIGAPSNVKTRIDFSPRFEALDAELQNLREEILAKEELLVGLEEAMGELSSQLHSSDVQGHYNKIENTISHVSGELVGLRDRRTELERQRESLFKKIQVDVYGMVYTGTEFSVCGKTYPLLDDRKSCVIKFTADKLVFN